MRGSKRGHIIPPEFRYAGDFNESRGKRVFRFLRMDPTLLIGREVSVTEDLIRLVLDVEQHIGNVSSPRFLQRESLADNLIGEYYERRSSSEIIEGALQRLKKQYGDRQPRLDSSLIADICRATQTEYSTHVDSSLVSALPCTAQEFCRRGVVNARRGVLDDALADYSSAIELDPEHAYYYYNRADCNKEKHNPTLALKDLELTIRYRDVDDMFLLLACDTFRAQLYVEMDRIEDALLIFKESHRLIKIVIEGLDWDKSGVAKVGKWELNAQDVLWVLKDYVTLCQKIIESVPDRKVVEEVLCMRRKFGRLLKLL